MQTMTKGIEIQLLSFHSLELPRPLSCIIHAFFIEDYTIQ